MSDHVSEMEIVNIVSSGDLGVELDLVSIYNDIDIEHIQYDPERFPGLQIRFTKGGPVITLFSSGSYTIVGAETNDQMHRLYDRLEKILQELGIDYDSEQSQPVVQNLICKDSLGREINLDELVIALGLENTEYEPEQSPFVYYWPEEIDCLITIPANGQCMVTGIDNFEDAQEAFRAFEERIDRLITSSKKVDANGG